MPRLLLLLPTATYRAPDFLKAAAEVGADVVVGSEQRQTMAEAMGDRAVVVPLEDPPAAVEAIVALHQRAPLDAVVAVDDQGVLVAALAAERLGLLHNPPEAVAATRDKAEMRTRLARAGVAQPRWQRAGPDDDVGAIAAAVGLPVVIKPISLSASRGVIRTDDPAAAVAVAGRIRSILADAGEKAAEVLLIEQFVPGAEVAVEAILRGGRLDVLAIFDKPDPLDGPYFEETIYVTPSRHPEAVQAAIERGAGAAAAAIGLREGPIHAELRVPSDGEPVVLEVAARSIGGLCSRTLRFGVGVTLEELIVRHALGLDRDGGGRGGAADGAAGVMMLPIPAEGTLERVDGRAEALAVPGIVGLDITINPGRPVRPLPEGDRYLGFVFARAPTPAEVEEALRTAFSRLDVVITATA